ncbi:MAG: sigma-70 family RNA polymerase sigma factor [Planctomycetes bacterium]|nr:sigma-70 family RNA polymerase sigma factor [Planctomycetota bacterium]
MRDSTSNNTAGRRPNPAMRKLKPTCQPPTGAVMRKLSANEAQRLRPRLVEELECIYDPGFSRAGAEKRFTPTIDEVTSRGPRPMSSRLDTRSGKARSLSRDEEVELFLRFNYCRYRMMGILRAHAGKRLTAAATRELLNWDQAALDVRDEIVQANLGLVPAMVERSRLTGVDFAELISEGQLALLRSVGKFDCSRGFKFSTYACRAILTSISRAVALMARHRARFPTEYDPGLQKADFVESRREEIEANCAQELQAILAGNLADLTVTEQRILSERFGMRGPGRNTARDSKTLRQVAEVFGVTKERVRQIQNRALAKLREVLDEQAFAS